MAATIRTTCGVCGTVEVAVSAARLHLSVDDVDQRNVLEFCCPKCGLPARQRVEERATRLLSRAGVELAARADRRTSHLR